MKQHVVQGTDFMTEGVYACIGVKRMREDDIVFLNLNDGILVVLQQLAAAITGYQAGRLAVTSAHHLQRPWA